MNLFHRALQVWLPGVIATLLITHCAQAQNAPIGRLFTTPQERYQLDVARGLIAPPPAPPVAAPAPPPPAPLTVDGFVRRSAGRSTVWVNQASQDARPAQFSGPANQPRVTLTLPGGARVKVKPGQTIDANNGSGRDLSGSTTP
jgi:hypothetical protein